MRFFMFSAIFSVGAAASHPRYWWKRHADNTEYADFKNPVHTEYGANAPNSNGENFFQEIYMLQSAPKQIEFGHVCENPHEWEQRYEKKDFDRNRHQGKITLGCSENVKNFQNSVETRSRCGTNFSLNNTLQRQIIYQHFPESKMYDFGFERGNSKYLISMYEKADPKYGLFKTKVRWADKRGNHGEHYWDYNHAGPSSVQEDADKDHKQHHKRQLSTEEKADSPLSEEAQEFLESFHREIEGVFNLRFNKNLFPEQGSDSFKHLTKNFRFFLPQIKDQPRKSKSSS